MLDQCLLVSRAHDFGGTTAQLSTNLLNTPEHRGIQANAAYQSVLGRDPNAAERSSAIAALSAGAQQTAVTVQGLASFSKSLNAAVARFRMDGQAEPRPEREVAASRQVWNLSLVGQR